MTRELLVVHADLLAALELVPLPIPGGEAPLLRRIRDAAAVRVAGLDRATPETVARLCAALGQDGPGGRRPGDQLRRAWRDGATELTVETAAE